MTGASQPVIVVPPDVRLAEAARFERVLIPLEGTEESTIGVAAGLEALAAAGVKIVTVHVFHSDTMPRFLDHAGHAEQSWGTEFLAHWCAQPHIDLHLRSGHVSGAILDVARAEHIDLIVIAWSRTMDHDRAKVVREILSRSDLPVLSPRLSGDASVSMRVEVPPRSLGGDLASGHLRRDDAGPAHRPVGPECDPLESRDPGDLGRVGDLLDPAAHHHAPRR